MIYVANPKTIEIGIEDKIAPRAIGMNINNGMSTMHVFQRHKIKRISAKLTLVLYLFPYG